MPRISSKYTTPRTTCPQTSGVRVRWRSNYMMPANSNPLVHFPVQISTSSSLPINLLLGGDCYRAINRTRLNIMQRISQKGKVAPAIIAEIMIPEKMTGRQAIYMDDLQSSFKRLLEVRHPGQAASMKWALMCICVHKMEAQVQRNTKKGDGSTRAT